MARTQKTFKSPQGLTPEVVGKARELYRELELKFEYRDINSLKPAKRRARKHSPKQIEQVAESIKAFGLVRPVSLDADGYIVTGHTIWEAAKLLGYDRVPTIDLAHLSEAERRALAIADNQLALLGAWDLEILGEELEFLTTCDVDFAPEVTGFSSAEIDVLTEREAEAGNGSDDQIPAAETKVVSRVGDLWVLGDHRLFCGDARSDESYRALLGDEKAAMAFVDLPYNVPINGHVMGSGAIKHDEFVMASGEMSESEFRTFIAEIAIQLIAFSTNGALHYLCMDWRHISDLIESVRSLYGAFYNVCVWNKSNGSRGGIYKSKHELIAVLKVGDGPVKNNVELGKHGRNRTNVWDYAGVNTFGRNRMTELSLHPTVKPCIMVVDAIRDCTRRGDRVLDVCGGSGTMIIAAAKCGRLARVMELDPKYVDVAVRRWQQWSGEAARHAATGATFEETALERLASPPNAALEGGVASASENTQASPVPSIRVRTRPTPRAAA